MINIGYEQRTKARHLTIKDSNMIKRMFICVCALLIMPYVSSAFAQVSQEVHVSGSPNPVGSGARALGMGGAFIGVADDATAASWNPGGLIQLETPEMSIVLSGDFLNEKRSFRLSPGASGDYNSSLYDINYLSLVLPFTRLKKNMIVSLNFQTLYSFNKSHNYNYSYRKLTTTLIESPLFSMETTKDTFGPRHTHQDTDGYLKALSPAFSIQVTPYLSFGITLNWFSPSLGSKWTTIHNDNLTGTLNQTMAVTPSPPVAPTVTSSVYSISQSTYYNDEFEFSSSLNPLGIFNEETSYNIGFLWHINSRFTMGGVYKAAYTARVRYHERLGYTQEMINLDDPLDVVNTYMPLSETISEIQEMDMPASYGLGLACRFSDEFSMAIDIYRTNWQDFLLRQANGNEISLITGQERSKSNTKPTHQVRIGTEYLFILNNGYVVPLRGGLFYDPEPTENRPDDFYGLTIGTGLTVGNIVFDTAYQFRWGNDVRKISLGQEETGQVTRQHSLYFSLIYHF